MYKYCFLTLILICCTSGTNVNTYHLQLILGAINDALQFMEENVSEINLDAVFCIRQVEEQLKAYLYFEPDVLKIIRPQVEKLRDKAANISDTGEKNIRKRGAFEIPTIGRMMSRHKRLLWHSSTETDPAYMISPLPCSRSNFNISISDICLMEPLGSSVLKRESCVFSEKCKRQMTTPGERDYFLTHQALYWQLSEMSDCRPNIPPDLELRLCSNIMRDAEEFERAGFPHETQIEDLFLEQVGICGMWGFRDFHKPEWLKQILQWQNPSGCYVKNPQENNLCYDNYPQDRKIREKRRDFFHKDGCSSHKTGVALMALTVSLRFEAERLFNQKTNGEIQGYM